MNFKSILELTEHFNTDLKCRKYLENILWKDGIICPHCANEQIYKFSDGRRFKCKTCKKQFTITVGTIFEGSHIPLQKWFVALYYLSTHSKGISSLQLSKDIGITQKSAWYMAHRIRYAIRTRSFAAPLQNVVEMDESYIGGKDANRHEYKKGMAKTAVFGMLERGGKVRAQSVKATDRETLHPIIHQNVLAGTSIMTDEARVYVSLRHKYLHEAVNHSLEEYVRGKIHTNGIENFWSLFKRGVIGIYHQISPKHLDKYLDEFETRFNDRKKASQERFNAVIGQTEGYLSYKELIANK